MSAYSVSAHGLAMRKVPQGVLDTVNQLLFDAGQVGGNLPFSDFSKIWQDSAGTTQYTAVEQYVGKIVDKSPNALAFTQATSAARPAVSARVNLLTKSENVDDTAWAKTTGVTVAADALVSPVGTPTADSISYSGAGAAGSYRVYSSAVVNPAPAYGLTTTVYLNSPTPQSVRLHGNVVAGGYVTCNLDSTWNKFTTSGVTNGVSAAQLLIYSTASDNSPFSIGMWGADIRYSSRNNLPYQYVNTATDYATAGFPHYLKFDGIDDNIVSAAGGGGTAGIYFCGAIQFNKVGAVQTIFSDSGTNSGYKLQLTAANQLQISAGNGTAFTAINTTDAFAVTAVSLVELWDDGTNLGVRLGEGTPVTVTRPVVTAGTAQITIGKDNNAASSYAGINMFEPVWRYGAMPNTTQREAIRAICRSKASIV